MNEVHADFHTLSPPLMSIRPLVTNPYHKHREAARHAESRDSAGGVNDLMINPDR